MRRLCTEGSRSYTPQGGTEKSVASGGKGERDHLES